MKDKTRLEKVFQLFVEAPKETAPLECLKDMFAYAGYDLEEKDLEEFKNEYQENGLSFEEFEQKCDELEDKQISKKEVDTYLKTLCDSSGFIDIDKLIKLLSSGKYKFEKDEINEIIDLMSPSAEGKVSVDYLLNMVYNEEYTM